MRTNAIHLLHPVVKLADGRLIVGDRGITTHGEFLTVEVAFSGMRWYALDPVKVVVLTEVTNPNLRRVDEVGLAMLSPAAGTASPDRRTCRPWSCSPIRCLVRRAGSRTGNSGGVPLKRNGWQNRPALRTRAGPPEIFPYQKSICALILAYRAG